MTSGGTGCLLLPLPGAFPFGPPPPPPPPGMVWHGPPPPPSTSPPRPQRTHRPGDPRHAGAPQVRRRAASPGAHAAAPGACAAADADAAPADAAAAPAADAADAAAAGAEVVGPCPHLVRPHLPLRVGAVVRRGPRREQALPPRPAHVRRGRPARRPAPDQRRPPLQDLLRGDHRRGEGEKQEAPTPTSTSPRASSSSGRSTGVVAMIWGGRNLPPLADWPHQVSLRRPDQGGCGGHDLAGRGPEGRGRGGPTRARRRGPMMLMPPPAAGERTALEQAGEETPPTPPRPLPPPTFPAPPPREGEPAVPQLNFLGGGIHQPPPEGSVFGILPDILYLCGAFLFSLFPFWNPEAIRLPEPEPAPETAPETEQAQNPDAEPEANRAAPGEAGPRQEGAATAKRGTSTCIELRARDPVSRNGGVGELGLILILSLCVTWTLSILQLS